MPWPFRIRLALHGCANRPFYHIVVLGKGRRHDARPREQIGTYDPLVNKNNEKLVAVNFDRLKYWVARGAMPTRPTAQLLGMSSAVFMSLLLFSRLGPVIFCFFTSTPPTLSSESETGVKLEFNYHPHC